MPIYEYECREHGLFERERAMSQSAQPCACPICHGSAPRVLSVPRIPQLPRARALARERNEKSRESPELRRVAPSARGPRAVQVSHGPRPWVLEHG